MASRKKKLESFEIEEFIRSNRLGLARKALKSVLKTKNLSSDERLQLANLCRRVFWPKLSLSLLHRQVRPPPRSLAVATEEEKCEYSAALIQLGALGEARELLRGVPTTFGEAYFHKALLAMREWDYGRAREQLQKFLRVSDSEVYLYQVAKVNLLACLQYEGFHSEAYELVDELISTSQKKQRLYANLLELKAQICISLKQFAKAQSSLEKAFELSSSTENSENLYLKKWAWVLTLNTQSCDREVEAQYHQLKNLAAKRLEFETLRDCDRHWAIYKGDSDLLNYLCTGTPFEHYQNRCIDEFSKKQNKDFVIDLKMAHCLGDFEEMNQVRDVDLSGSLLLKANSIPFRFLEVLLSDRYAPFSFFSLFSKIYRDTYFDPQHSKNVFHQGVNRLRNAIAREKLPVKLLYKKGFYSLTSKRPMRFLLQNKRERGHKEFLGLVGRLDENFLSKDLAQALSQNQRTAQRLLAQWLEDGWIKKKGVGKSSRYYRS